MTCDKPIIHEPPAATDEEAAGLLEDLKRWAMPIIARVATKDASAVQSSSQDKAA